MRKSKVTLRPQPVGRLAGRLGSSALGGITGIVRGRGGDWGWTEGETTDGAERRIQLQPVQLRCCPLPIPTLRFAHPGDTHNVPALRQEATPPTVTGHAPYHHPHIPDNGLLQEPEPHEIHPGRRCRRCWH